MLHYHWYAFFEGASKPSEEENETNGVLTSPNFGDGLTYPNNLDNKQTIQVEEGKAIKIHFTDWDVEPSPGGKCDYVTITEGDGSTLANIRYQIFLNSLSARQIQCMSASTLTAVDNVLAGGLFGVSTQVFMLLK